MFGRPKSTMSPQLPGPRACMEVYVVCVCVCIRVCMCVCKFVWAEMGRGGLKSNTALISHS